MILYEFYLHFFVNQSCNNFYSAQNKNYYNYEQPINAIITFTLSTSGTVNIDGTVVRSNNTRTIKMTIKDGNISLDSNAVESHDTSTYHSNGTTASISNIKLISN